MGREDNQMERYIFCLYKQFLDQCVEQCVEQFLLFLFHIQMKKKEESKIF